jgi:hypothetical protein
MRLEFLWEYTGKRSQLGKSLNSSHDRREAITKAFQAQKFASELRAEMKVQWRGGRPRADS